MKLFRLRQVLSYYKPSKLSNEYEEVFEQIMIRVNKEVNSWGGNLFFVYIHLFEILIKLIIILLKKIFV